MKRLLSFLALFVLPACIARSPDDRSTTLMPAVRPSLDAFAVSPGPADMLSARCGTLDCHGQAGRPLRIYGENGLRLDPDDVPGGRPRTEAETHATYVSVIGLEPEQLDAAPSDPSRLLLVRKALGTERHKGASVFVDESDPGYGCLAAWLRAEDVASACR
jgi:hypothetical protein